MFKVVNRNEVSDDFAQFYERLTQFGIDYFTVLADSVETPWYLSSEPGWVELYSNHQYIVHDPLYRAAILTPGELIYWDQLALNSLSAAKIMQARQDYGMNPGLSFKVRKCNIDFIISMAPESKQAGAMISIMQHDGKSILRLCDEYLSALNF